MIWTSIILCGIITFLIRFIPLSGVVSTEPSPFIKNSFKYIPMAVLTPIIVNDLSIIQNNSFFFIDNYKLYAGVIAIIVAVISKNILATITLGMGTFLIMSNFINI